MLFEKNSMKNQKGFTLIELLIVIAIIGILAVIAVPKFAESTATARTAKVQADLRAMDTAIQIYSVNHGKTPETINDIKDYLTAGAVPAVEDGNYRIAGTTISVTNTSYQLNDAKDRAEVTFNNVSYTADTLKPNASGAASPAN